MLNTRDYMTKVGRYLRRRGRPTPKTDPAAPLDARFADLGLAGQPDDPGPESPAPRPPLHGGKKP